MELSLPFTKFGRLKTGRGKSKVNLYYLKSLNTVFVSLSGGKPHFGALTAGLKFNSKQVSKTYKMPGHRDDVVTKKVSSILAKKFNGAMFVTAGIHYDDITKAQIRDVLKNSEKLGHKLAAIISNN